MLWFFCFALIALAVAVLGRRDGYQPPLELSMLSHQRHWAEVKAYLGENRRENLI